jgi:hypothetical protein
VLKAAARHPHKTGGFFSRPARADSDGTGRGFFDRPPASDGGAEMDEDSLDSDHSDWSGDEQHYMETQSHGSDPIHHAAVLSSSEDVLYRGRYDHRQDHQHEPTDDGNEHMTRQQKHHPQHTREHRKHHHQQQDHQHYRQQFEKEYASSRTTDEDTAQHTLQSPRSVTPDNRSPRSSAPVATARHLVAPKPCSVSPESRTADSTVEQREVTILEGQQEEKQSASAITNLSRCVRSLFAWSKAGRTWSALV